MLLDKMSASKQSIEAGARVKAKGKFPDAEEIARKRKSSRPHSPVKNPTSSLNPAKCSSGKKLKTDNSGSAPTPAQTQPQNTTMSPSLRKFRIPKRRIGNANVSQGGDSLKTQSISTAPHFFSPCIKSSLKTTIDSDLDDKDEQQGKKRKCESSASEIVKGNTRVKDSLSLPNLPKAAAQGPSTSNNVEPKVQNNNEVTHPKNKEGKAVHAPPPVTDTDKVIKKRKKRRPRKKKNSCTTTTATSANEQPQIDGNGNSNESDSWNFNGAQKFYQTSGYKAFSDRMDVDVVASPNKAFIKQLILVPDTNVWIGNQGILDQLLNADFTTTGQLVNVTIVIPWMVLQEVDHVIHRNTSSSNAAAFRNASKYINRLLSAKHPKIKGQKATEAIIGIEFNELMADDSILNCAIQYDKDPLNQTVFITNDINLLNKALVHDMKAFKADGNLISNLRQLFTQIENPFETSVHQAAVGSEAVLSSLPVGAFSPSSETVLQSSATDADLDVSMEVDDEPMELYENLPDVVPESRPSSMNSFTIYQQSEPVTFETVVCSVQRAFTNIIVLKMIEEYGQDGWRFAIKIPPPFTVESAFKCIQVHWIAVFSYLFASRAKVVIDELLELFKNKPVSLNETDVTKWRLEISQLTLALFSMIDNKTKRPPVLECSQTLQAYIEFLKNTVKSS